MTANRRFLLTLLFALATSGIHPQNAACQVLYSRWKSDGFHNFGSVDPQTGQRVTIASIPRSSSFSVATASNTLDPMNNIIYFSAIESGNWLYSVGMETGSVNRISIGGDRLDWLNYDSDSQVLYGRWKSDDFYNFGSVDPQTGQRVTIASIPRSPSFSVAAFSNTLDPVNNIIYFSAIESGNWLYSVGMDTGSINRTSIGGDPLVWLDVTPEPSTLILLSIGGLALLRKRRTL